MARANGMRSTMVRRALKALTSRTAHAARKLSPRRSGSIFAALAVAVFSLLCTVPATGSETITYSYDALGRLIKVAHAGTVNSSTSGCYTYDGADNRTNVAVSTTADCAAPPQAVTFSVNDVSVAEGGNLVFTVTKTGTTSATTTIGYQTADGSAAAGSDYTAKAGTLTFLSTDTSMTVSVPTTDDALVESAETMVLDLSNTTGGAGIGDGQGIGTINDNDADCVSVSFTISSNGAVTEGANSIFTVRKSGATNGSCSVNYATSDLGIFEATAGTDYTATSGTLTFTSAQTSKTVSVPTANDTQAEGDETFQMALSSPDRGGALGNPSSATATINDNDQCIGITFTIASNGPVTEGAGSTFTITKAGSSSWTCSVNYGTANATATAPGDYTATSGTLGFLGTQTSKTVTVATVNDSVVESAETFKMNLSNPQGGSVLGTPNSATATINDNDSGGVCSGVSFAVSDASATEGDPLTFTVSKTGSTSSSCSISYATANGTAIAGTNYTAKSGTLTFSSTQTTQNLTVSTIDVGLGKSKKMQLNLSTASGGASISDSQGIGTIEPDGSVCTTCLQSVDPGTLDTTSRPADTTATTAPEPQP